jgi:AraC family transcriptional regulator, regulatory protein of adaptative response / methylated-DNA-[protein]-cysteine methyltransferase
MLASGFDRKDRGAPNTPSAYLVFSAIELRDQAMPRTAQNAASTPAQAKAPSLDEARWDAFMARDAAYDGRFFVAVKTTGIYCRPSCPARRPKRDNVRFYSTAAEALRAGFRPCKRCKPDQPSLLEQHAEKIEAACRMIESAEAEPKLDALASAAGLSPYHFHRLFKSALGVTPKAYAAAHRQQRVRRELGRSATITEAIYGAGFNSNGRFYAASSETLGMTPSEFRAGGHNAEISYTIGECSLGLLLVAASGKGVCAIFFGDDPETLVSDLNKQFPRARITGDPAFAALLAKVIGFVEDPRRDLDLPLDIRGTAFQRRVWEALRRIPPGATATYADIAKAIGSPAAVRAVGRACGSNPIALAIPCHRVVGSNGSLTGYRGGVERKRALLAKEAKS